MHQSEINCAVARITNESIPTIKRYGFSIEEPPKDFSASDIDEVLSRESYAEGVTGDLALC